MVLEDDCQNRCYIRSCGFPADEPSFYAQILRGVRTSTMKPIGVSRHAISSEARWQATNKEHVRVYRTAAYTLVYTALKALWQDTENAGRKLLRNNNTRMLDETTWNGNGFYSCIDP